MDRARTLLLARRGVALRAPLAQHNGSVEPMSRVAHLRQRVSSRLAGIENHDLLALTAFAALSVLVILTFGDYAISNDEAVQHRYGELILSYYASGFLDRTLFQYDNLYLYGGLFDVIAILLDRLLPFNIFSIRHFLCAL